MTTSVPALQVTGLSKAFGGLRVFDNLTFDLNPGEILGVIGPNGAGKTTLVNVLSKQIPATSGEIQLYGGSLNGKSFTECVRAGLARSFQQTNVFSDATVEHNLKRALRFAGKPASLPASAIKLIDHCGLQRALQRRAVDLPYGLQKMLGLLMTYLTAPKVMLLDEPAAGLERRERSLIDTFVETARTELNCSVVIVEHDMDMIRRICPRSIVLEAGRILAIGPTKEVLANPEVIKAYLGEVAEDTDAVDR